MVSEEGPTIYKDVNAILSMMQQALLAMPGDKFPGFYLYGSLSLGDFDPASSDIDFLVVTKGELSAEHLERLRVMHEEIAASGLPYATRLEGSYIPRAALRRYDPEQAKHPTIGVDWPFQIGEHRSSWIIERYIVREHGVVVWGPAPETLIDPVLPVDIRRAVWGMLQEFWSAQLSGPDWLRPREYQAFIVFTMCRALYTLREGRVSSKPVAAAWAREAYPQWVPMIERAYAWRTQHEDDDLTESLAFLREALSEAQRVYEQKE